MRPILPAALLASVALAATPAAAATVERVGHGVVVTPDAGPAKRVRVLVYGSGRFRITAVPTERLDLPDSLMVDAAADGDFAVNRTATAVTLRTAAGSAEVRLADGHVRVLDAAGRVLVDEAARGSFQPVSLDGGPWYRVSQQFNRGTAEGFYGLGQHQNRQMNYNGEDVELAQHNMDIAIPFVVSTAGYGLLWDNNGISRFGNPRPYSLVGEGLSVTSGGQPGWKADYYLGKRLAVSRREATIDYRFIRDQAKWPEAAKARTVASPDSGQNTAGNAVEEQRVVWTGTIRPTATGTHSFRLYSSSYVRVYADGKPVLDRWRQNWNPWFHNFTLPITAGKPVAIRVEWVPNQGYIGLLHNDPLPAPDRQSLWMTSEVAKGIDYYVVAGGSMDGTVSGYRALTGKAVLMPQWTYGFWQSRQRYDTQAELVDVLARYRRQSIPIDAVVQDWFYWPKEQWGSHDFDPARFPDPEGLTRQIHAMNGHVMISVWPKFYPNTDNAKALDAKGWLYRGNLTAGRKDWIGYPNTDYDPYAPGARKLYFQQVRDKLVTKGFDAWWLDATEPDVHSNLSIEERLETMGPTAAGPAAAFFNSFPLVHGDGVAEGLNATQPDRRPFILTRSGFGGLQRASAAVWSGDVAARWDDLRDQISAGVNLSLSGIPNWTHDIGGFAVEDRYTRQLPSAQAEWRELNLRWFQFGAFSPLFRSHGEAPHREIDEISAGDPAMREAMVDYDRLRYRLLPYIYSTAADTWVRDGTIMRGLVMDFGADRRTWNVDDEYLLGPAFLVAPVTQYRARSRSVYLPQGADWYEWDTGAFHRGGRAITAAAPRERMPLFVRAGAIVPVGPAIQYAAQGAGKPITLHVFTGADGRFTLHQDDGISQDYKKGSYARTPIAWDDRAGTLTIGKREGRYTGMPATQTLAVRFHGPGDAAGSTLDAAPARQVAYDGGAVTIRR